MEPATSTLWMFLIRKDGRLNWLSAVGAVLFLSAMVQCVLALVQDRTIDRQVEEARLQWAQVDILMKNGAPSKGEPPITVTHPLRPDTLRKELEREVNSRFLWAGLGGLLGAAVFMAGALVDSTFHDPTQPK